MIVGVDVSSHRIDLAWLENNRPQRWHQELAKGHLIDRLRSIDIHWPKKPQPDPYAEFQAGGDMGWDVTDIAIEYPFGRGNAIAALMATLGVITRQAPPWARVAWPSSQELRAAIGARNNKESAHYQLWPYFGIHHAPTTIIPRYLRDWDEHELDALVACTGWTEILRQQDAA